MKTSKYFKNLIWANIISLLVFIFLLIEISYNSFLVKLDFLINSSTFHIQNYFLTTLSIIIGFIFDIKSIIVISLILSVYLLIKFSKKEALFFAFTMAIAGLFVYTLKYLIQRARPLNALISETGFSFPSAHAAIAIVFFGLLIYLISKKKESRSLKLTVLLISIFMILLICFARVYLNVHWFSDVLGGIAIGAFVLSGGIIAREIFDKR